MEEKSDLDEKDPMEEREEVNPIERKLEIMGNLSKRVKLSKLLIEKTFKEMRSDYSEHHYKNFEKYRKDFETVIFLAKNLVLDNDNEEENDKKLI